MQVEAEILHLPLEQPEKWIDGHLLLMIFSFECQHSSYTDMVDTDTSWDLFKVRWWM